MLCPGNCTRVDISLAKAGMGSFKDRSRFERKIKLLQLCDGLRKRCPVIKTFCRLGFRSIIEATKLNQSSGHLLISMGGGGGGGFNLQSDCYIIIIGAA